jgi:hypothetical protein
LRHDPQFLLAHSEAGRKWIEKQTIPKEVEPLHVRPLAEQAGIDGLWTSGWGLRV